MSDYQTPDPSAGSDDEPRVQVSSADTHYSLFHRLFERGDVALVAACFAIEARTEANHHAYRFWTGIFRRFRPELASHVPFDQI